MRPRKIRTDTFEALYREHYTFVWRCLRRFGVRAETEDAAQEVFITAYRRLHTYEGRGSMRGWLAGIARRIAFRARRTHERRRRRHEAPRLPAGVDDVEGWIRRKEAAVFLDAFLDALDPDKRSMFVLCELEGLQGREAARVLGLNPNTAYSRLRSARASFQRACATAQADGSSNMASRTRRAHRESPSPRAVERGWAVFVARIGYVGTVAGTSAATAPAWTWSSAKIAVVLVVLGGAALGVTVAPGDGSRSPDSTVVTTNTHNAPSAPSSTALGPSRMEDPPVQPLRVARSPAPPRDHAAKRSSDPPAARRKTEPGRPRADTGLTGPEHALLRRASTAYGRGRIDAAIEMAGALLTEYPESFLALDARVLLVKAHCAQQRRARAAAVARRLPPAEGSRLLRQHCDAVSRDRGQVETTRVQ